MGLITADTGEWAMADLWAKALVVNETGGHERHGCQPKDD